MELNIFEGNGVFGVRVDIRVMIVGFSFHWAKYLSGGGWELNEMVVDKYCRRLREIKYQFDGAHPFTDWVMRIFASISFGLFQITWVSCPTLLQVDRTISLNYPTVRTPKGR